jgi:F-type H+-transporting ATPase subunit epsilon
VIHFQLVSASGLKFNGDVYEVLLPTQSGTIAVFEDHMPLLSAGNPGVISVRKKPNDRDSDMEQFAVNGGILEVDGKNLRFLSDEVTTSEEVNEKAAEAAYARAQELMSSAQTQVALHEAKRMLHHTSAQLHIAKLKRRHHQ